MSINPSLAKESRYAADPRVHIGHVHLKVADLERALSFYAGVLGLEVTQRLGDSAAFLAAGDYHHHIAVNTWESLGGFPPPSWHDRALPHGDRLSNPRCPCACSAEGPACAHSTRRSRRPRRQPIHLLARSRRQRSRALLGQAKRPMAAHRRRQAGNVHPPTRSDPTAKRSAG